MRIIGGKFRSRVLASFDGEDVRPTADRVKESLFNILSLRFYGARVLDLFCGTGALGLESLSRGAREVVFNDQSKQSVTLLKKNLKTLKLQEGNEVKVCNLDASVFLDGAREPFDLIFIDPPYALGAVSDAIDRLVRADMLRRGAIVVAESDRATPFENHEELENLFTDLRHKTYGPSHIHIMTYAPPKED